MRKKLQTILEQFAKELPEYQAAAVVTVDDGLAVAEFSNAPDMETEAAAAYLASIVKSNAKAIGLLAGKQQTEDILVTTDQSYYLIRDLPGHKLFIFLMIKRGEWIGKARMLLKEHEAEIVEILTEYFSFNEE
jgi:predicted regulator of Ras-like GTPase activity (Roadblock/LC7/MglB family)